LTQAPKKKIDWSRRVITGLSLELFLLVVVFNTWALPSGLICLGIMKELSNIMLQHTLHTCGENNAKKEVVHVLHNVYVTIGGLAVVVASWFVLPFSKVLLTVMFVNIAHIMVKLVNYQRHVTQKHQ